MCLLGQSKVFSEASEIFNKLIGLDISGMQIQRVCKYYGGLIDPIISKNLEQYIPKLKDVKEEDKIYVMVDGSMINTRENKWKEVKLGRIFNQRKIIPISESRTELVESVYVSHMGSVKGFFPKLERHLVPYKNKVIIGDGATWIWNWAEDNYPGATQILDFYHAKEKLVLFANHQFKDFQKKQDWLKEQTKRLKEDEVENVISTLKSIRSKNEKAKDQKEKTIKYFTDHDDRMLYKTGSSSFLSFIAEFGSLLMIQIDMKFFFYFISL